MIVESFKRATGRGHQILTYYSSSAPRHGGCADEASLTETRSKGVCVDLYMFGDRGGIILKLTQEPVLPLKIFENYTSYEVFIYVASSCREAKNQKERV